MSDRYITVWNGERYEIQTVTSVPTSKYSTLRPSANFYVETESEQAADNIRLCTTAVTGLIGATSVGKLSTIQSMISNVTTLYDLYNAYNDAISPTTIVQGVDNTGLISMSIHEKHIFVKMEGAADTSQVLALVSNRVSYTAGILFESDSMSGIISQDGIDYLEFGETYYSQYFGTIDENGDGIKEKYNDHDSMITKAAQTFWECRITGKLPADRWYLVENVVFSWAGGEVIRMEVPYNGIIW